MNSAHADIAELEDRRYRAMLAGDVAELDRLLDENLLYIHSGGSADDKRSYLEYIRSGAVQYREFHRSNTRIRVFGETAALVTGAIVIRLQLKGQDRELNSIYSGVWVRPDGCWRLVCWQATPVRS
jgi:hypothetical protein